jgi:hypothetical protein
LPSQYKGIQRRGPARISNKINLGDLVRVGYRAYNEDGKHITDSDTLPHLKAALCELASGGKLDRDLLVEVKKFVRFRGYMSFGEFEFVPSNRSKFGMKLQKRDFYFDMPRTTLMGQDDSFESRG